MIKQTLWLSAFLCLSGCADFNNEFPITTDNNVHLPSTSPIIPSTHPIDTPTEVIITAPSATLPTSTTLPTSLNKSPTEIERKEQEEEQKKFKLREKIKPTLEAVQTETLNQALQSFIIASKKQGVGEITLFFAKGSDSLEFSSERDRLIQFLDYISRESHGRKIMLLSIGSASIADTPSNKYEVYGVRTKKAAPKKSLSNKIQLSVARAKAPLDIIEKYLVNIPHQTYDAYGIGERKSPNKMATATEQEKYQHVRIIASFEKSDLPLLPK